MGNDKITPDWFKMKKDYKILLRMLDKESMATTILLAYDYLDTFVVPDEVRNLEPLAMALFGYLKDSIDESAKECARISEIRRNAANARWHPDET